MSSATRQARARRYLEPLCRSYPEYDVDAVAALVVSLEDDLDALVADAEAVDADHYAELVREEYGIDDDRDDAVGAHLEAMVAGERGRPTVEFLNPVGAFTDAIRVMLRHSPGVRLDLETELDDPEKAERVVVDATYGFLADLGEELK